MRYDPNVELPRHGYHRDGLTEGEIAEQAAAAGPLAASVRELIDAVVRTEIAPAELDDVRHQVEALTERLRAQQFDGSYGIRFGEAGDLRNWGNAVVGLKNAIAPPLHVHRDGTRVWADVELGAAYEGPAGLAHGGVSALLLDQMLGEAAAAARAPGMTGTLTLRYRAGTPLGTPLRLEAYAERTGSIKAIARGRLTTRESEPTLCVEAEGIFILPRWARGADLDAN